MLMLLDSVCSVGGGFWLEESATCDGGASIAFCSTL